MQYRRHLVLAVLVLVGALFGGCNSGGEPAVSTNKLLVAAASNLRFALPEIGKMFQMKTGALVQFTFGASGSIAYQIEHGAPFDVFVSADIAHMERLKDLQLILPDTISAFAQGALVLAWPEGHRRISDLAELARPEIKSLTLANPDHAPYGRAAREALVAKGIWQSVKSKVVYAETVSQSFQYVQIGSVDAGLVALSDVLAFNHKNYMLVDQSLYAPLIHVVAVVSASTRKESARRFVEFMASPDAQALLEQYGYKRVHGHP